MNMKVAIYCRLSEEDRNKQFETDDSNSIQNQKAMLLQYAMEQGWDVYKRQGYPFPMLAKKLSPFTPTTEETLILPNLRKRKTLQSAKITTLPKIHIQFCGTFSFVLFFDFRYLFCGGCYNPNPHIAYAVEQRVKLPPLRVLFGRLIWKKLVYGYIVTEHKLKENLQTRCV